MESYALDADGTLRWPHKSPLACPCDLRVTRIIAPAATAVNCEGCTGLTSLDLPAATTVDCEGCTGLTSLDLPAATAVDCWGCTGVAENFNLLVPSLLEAGGRSLGEVLATGCWEYHDWTNCPIHTAFGADDIKGVPQEFRGRAAVFISLFDHKMLRKPSIAPAA